MLLVGGGFDQVVSKFAAVLSDWDILKSVRKSSLSRIFQEVRAVIFFFLLLLELTFFKVSEFYVTSGLGKLEREFASFPHIEPSYRPTPIRLQPHLMRHIQVVTPNKLLQYKSSERANFFLIFFHRVCFV